MPGVSPRVAIQESAHIGDDRSGTDRQEGEPGVTRTDEPQRDPQQEEKPRGEAKQNLPGEPRAVFVDRQR